MRRDRLEPLAQAPQRADQRRDDRARRHRVVAQRRVVDVVRRPEAERRAVLRDRGAQRVERDERLARARDRGQHVGDRRRDRAARPDVGRERLALGERRRQPALEHQVPHVFERPRLREVDGAVLAVVVEAFEAAHVADGRVGDDDAFEALRHLVRLRVGGLDHRDAHEVAHRHDADELLRGARAFDHRDVPVAVLGQAANAARASTSGPIVSGSPVIHSETLAVDASEPAAARRIMSRSVRMPIARSSWSMTTTDPTRRSRMRCAATATVSAGCAVTTGVDMTSATVRSPGCRNRRVRHAPGFYDSGVGAGAPCRPAPCANRIAPSSDSPDASVACACRSSMRIASSSGSPHCSYDESRSSRRQMRRERRELVRERARRVERAARFGQPVGETHAQRFVAADAAAGEDEVERVRVADQARQADRAAVDERHTPPPAEHAEHRVARRDAQVAPQRELEPARDRVALDRGDHRLRRAASASGPSDRRRRRSPRCRASSPTAFRSAPAQNVPPAPVRIATSRVVVGVERAERVGERAAVARSTALRTCGPIDGHDRDRAVVFDDDG